MSEIRGLCPARFAAVRDAFAANFAAGLELGARFALAIEGEIVVNLMGGWADRHETAPFGEETLTSVFSTTKAMASLMLARLVSAGALSYETPVAETWPELATSITVGQMLSHQSGLCGLAGPMQASDWFDWRGVIGRLEAATPLWPPGTASGYHPVTFGYLAGEVFRRIDGRSLGAALREDIAEPLGLDLWIGLPDGEHARCADVRRPPSAPNLRPLTQARRLAFLTRWASPGGVSLAEWRRAAIPSVTGHATAPALARMMAILACDGMGVLEPGVAAQAGAERIAGDDLVLPYALSWGAGFLRNAGIGIYGPGEESFGHSGWGGSCAFADPRRRLSGAYVMNRQSADLIGDARSRRLIDAAYQAI